MNNLPYRQGIYVVIYDQSTNQVIIYSGKKMTQGHYKFPGGGIDEGETPEVAAVRETKEELGIDIHIEQFSEVVDKFEWPEAMQQKYGYRGQEKQFCLAYYDSKNPLVIEEDAVDVKWVSVNDLDKYFLFPEQPARTAKVLKDFGIVNDIF